MVNHALAGHQEFVQLWDYLSITVPNSIEVAWMNITAVHKAAR
jgi:hypothetical protein